MNTNYIKGRMYHKGMNQSDLAKKLGTDQARISLIINGKANPTMKTLEKLANALNCKVKDLL